MVLYIKLLVYFHLEWLKILKNKIKNHKIKVSIKPDWYLSYVISTTETNLAVHDDLITHITTYIIIMFIPLLNS